MVAVKALAIVCCNVIAVKMYFKRTHIWKLAVVVNSHASPSLESAMTSDLSVNMQDTANDIYPGEGHIFRVVFR